MLVPVRCFTCNGPVRHVEYEALRLEGTPPLQIFEAMGVQRTCCRRMLLSIPDGLTEKISPHSALDMQFDDPDTRLRLHVRAERTLPCD